MQVHKRRRTKQGEISHLIVQGLRTAVLLLLAILSVRAAWGMYGKFAAASEGQQVAQTQLAVLQAQKDKIGTDVAELNSPRGIETQLRQRYGVAKPGEGEIQVVANQNVATTTSRQSNILQRLWHALVAW